MVHGCLVEQSRMALERMVTRTDPLSAPLSLSELWQALDQVRRHPEDLESSLFELMSQAIAPLPLSEQLAVAGFVFDQLAGVVNTRATLLIESWESWHRPTDPVLDFSRDPDLLVQSQRLELSDLVNNTPAPVFYPSQRKSPTSPDSAFDDEADNREDDLSDDQVGGDTPPEVPTAPLSESEVLASIKSLSHGENIPLWSAQVSAAMQVLRESNHRARSLPLSVLQRQLNLPLVEVWLALLLGYSGYQLSRPAGGELADFKDWADAFYSGAALQVSAAATET